MLDTIFVKSYNMTDKPKKELSSLISDNVQKQAMDQVESVIRNETNKMTISPFLQGLCLGLACGRFPVGLFLTAGAGLFAGLYLEENFHLPDIYSSIITMIPKEKKKDDD